MGRLSSTVRTNRAHTFLCNIVAPLFLLPLAAVAEPIDLNQLFHEPGALLSSI